MKKVYKGLDLTQVHIVKGILEAQGIKAKVEDDQLLGLVGGVGYTEAIVWIFDDARYEEALATVKEYEDKLTSMNKGEKWTCSVCNEVLDEQFTMCWNCNSSRLRCKS